MKHARSRIPRFPAVGVIVLVSLLVAGHAGAQTRNWPSEGPPRPLSARDVKFPPYELKALPNGMQVVVVMHHEQPAVSLRLLVRAGSAQDPSGKAGVASLVAALLDQGTTTRSAQQVADTIDFVGGALDTGAGRDLSFAHVMVMKDSFDLAISLLSDVVRHPAFAAQEIERQRDQLMSAMKVSYDDPEYLANIVFDRLVYGFHPYGFPNNGTPDSISRITRDDLVAFHQRYFAPNNCILAIVGDVTADEALSATGKTFGDWPRQAIPADEAPDPPPPTRRIIVLDKPAAVQTEMRVGHLGIPRKQDDYMAVDLALRILGGEGSNRLQRVLRTERGLTYGASADMEALRRTGEFVAQTNTRSAATGEVLRLIVDEFSRIRRDRVGEQELADAQAYLAGSFPLSIETPDEIATKILNVLFYELPLDELQTYRQRVNAVTVDDIARVARQYIKPDRLSVVLVGNASAFIDQLQGLGFARVERVPVADLDLGAADFRRATPPAVGSRPPSFGSLAPRERLFAGTPPPAYRTLPVAGTWTAACAASRARGQAAGQTAGQSQTIRTAALQASAQQLIDRVVEVMGGLETLRSIRTIVATATNTFFDPQGTRKAETKTYIEYPDRFRVDTKTPSGDIVQVYAGGDAWMQDPRGVHSVPEPVRDAARASVKRDVVALLLGAASGRVKARVLAPPATPGPDKPGAGDRGLQPIELTGDDMEPITMWVDSTARIAKLGYQVSGPRGRESVEEQFSDYRPIDGVQVAFKATVRSGGVTLAERTVNHIKFNVPVDPALFKKPE